MEHEFHPCTSVSLQRYVLNFFRLSGDGPEESLIVPSGFQYLVFLLGGEVDCITATQRMKLEGNAMVIFVHSEYFTLRTSAGFAALGIVLKPNGIYQFLGEKFTKEDFFISNMEHLRDKEKIDQLFVELQSQQEVTLQLSLLESFLHSRLNQLRTGDLVERFLEMVELSDKTMTTRKMAAALFTNQRSLEQKFHSVTGTTPGKYIKLRRFAKAFEEYLNTDRPVKELILTFNYTDYSHFSRDFFKHTGRLPKEFERNARSSTKAHFLRGSSLKKSPFPQIELNE